MADNVKWNWTKITKATLPPDDRYFMTWSEEDIPPVAVCRTYKFDGGDRYILYADELLCDVAPEGPVGATHWAEYPEGPTD